MSETPMREKLAIAAYQTINDGENDEWEHQNEAVKLGYRAEVTTILQAMLEPSDGMLEAASDQGFTQTQWRTVIQHILAGGS